MNHDINEKLISVLNKSIIPLQEQERYDPLIQRIADARFVLIGEASHGTQEFYQARIDITKKLIEEKGFMAVAIEGDWPDVYRVHRYLQGAGNIDEVSMALADFKRFPTWMWRNSTMPPFLRWLRSYNDEQLPGNLKVGFYGLDLYSLNASMQAVIDYLTKQDPEAAERARQRYACFDHLHTDPQLYGYLINAGMKKSCIKEAVAELIELQHKAFAYLKQDSQAAEDEYFYATQNARLVKNAEKYYRSMYEGQVSSWNNRDRHMVETLNVLIDHLESRYNKPAKIIIWAHNSHVGDARATEMGERGEVNIGQLVKEQYGSHSYSIGFSSYEGSVTAASNWDEPAECKQVVPGLQGSYEALFHQLQAKNFLLNLAEDDLDHYLQFPRLQRAIGVIYRPETERFSHYFFTHLPYQFDSLIHLDKTTALQALDSSGTEL